MKIYLDNCCLQRPLDDKSQLRIRLESEAILAALAMWEGGTADIVSSEVLEVELDRNPDVQRRAYAREIIDKAALFVEVSSPIIQRAKVLEALGFLAMDALHVACAEAAQVDYFCTCDDRLLRQARRSPGLSVRVVSPLELAKEIME